MSVESTLAQRYAVTASMLDARIRQYSGRSDGPEAAYLTAMDMLPTAHTDLAGMLAVAIRRAARRQQGLRTVRRRAIARSRVWAMRALDAENPLSDALDERDFLRAQLCDRDEVTR